MIRTKMNPHKSWAEALVIVDVVNINRLVFLYTDGIEQIVVDRRTKPAAVSGGLDRPLRVACATSRMSGLGKRISKLDCPL